MGIYAWNWTAVLQVFLGAGLGTAAFNGLFAVWRERRSRNRSAEHLALNIAVVLEDFAEDCAAVLADKTVYKTPPHSLLVPELQPYPSDNPEAWQALKKSFAERSMTFRGEVRARRRISNTVASAQLTEVRSDDFIAAQAAGAAQLANDLRLAYGFPPNRLRGYGILASQATSALERKQEIDASKSS